MASSNVTVELSEHAPLVLYDWLVRFNAGNEHSFEDQAEQRVIWDVECILERTLVAPLEPRYRELLRL